MLKIYFCEDDHLILKTYCQLVEKLILCQNWEMEIGGTFTAPEELLTHLPSKNDSGFYFLDIEFASSMDGFELAREIRRQDPKGFFVFITSHQELTLNVFQYRLEAMDFIIKSVLDSEMINRIFSCLQTAYERYCALNLHSDEILSLKSGKNLRFVPCSRIRYIQNSKIPHHILVYTTEELLDQPGSLESIYQKHTSVFLKCSRSLLVNRTYIKEVRFDQRKVILYDGTSLSCSIRQMKDFKKLI